MGTGLDLRMDRKIPTALWKTQLLKLVSEAPKAICIECDEPSSSQHHHHHHHHDHHHHVMSHSNSNSPMMMMRATPTSFVSSSPTSSAPDIHLTTHHLHSDHQQHQHHRNSSTGCQTFNNHLFSSNNGLLTILDNDVDEDEQQILRRVETEIDVDDDKLLENNGFSTETLKTTSSSSMSSTTSNTGVVVITTNNNDSPPILTWDPLLMDSISNPFGKAFHGYLSHSQTSLALKKDGHYLVRKRSSNDDDFVLSLRFNGHIKNFQISYEDSTGCFYIGERDKPYKSVQELVQEGLITLYLDQKEGPYIDLMCDLSKFHLGVKSKIPSSSSSLHSTSSNATTVQRNGSGVGNFNGNGHSKYYTTNDNNYKTNGHNNHNHNGFNTTTTGYLHNNSLQTVKSATRNGSSSPSPTVSTTASNGSSSERQTRRNQELRTHLFSIHTFKELSTCQICQKFLWGLSSQGLQCADCEMSIHESCLKEVQPNCKPNLENFPSIFGTSLNVLVKSGDGFQPPFILEKCIAQIEKRGLTMEGIYRVSGSKELIERLKTRMNLEREHIDLTNYTDIHSMCGLVKLYLRGLPDPLITSEVFDRFLANSGSLTLDVIKRNLRKLPPTHQVTLKCLLQHLYRVTEKVEQNKMNAYNLASVFTPSVICPKEISLNTIKIGTSILETMITYVPLLYPEKQTRLLLL